MAGSLLIGLLLGVAERNSLLSPHATLLMITGFCGGFTTFSAFADDMFLLAQQRHWVCLGLYVGTSCLLGAALVCLGRWLAARG